MDLFPNYDVYSPRRETHIRRCTGWCIPLHSAGAFRWTVTTAYLSSFQSIRSLIRSGVYLCTDLKEGSNAFGGLGTSLLDSRLLLASH